MRACREMGIASVAVYSEADKEALFTKYTDEGYFIGPAPSTKSYLNIGKIIETAEEHGVGAIHPGYGFLAENPNFAYACEQEGIKFIGPSSKVLNLMGNKVGARREMGKAGVPVVPGTDESIVESDKARWIANEIGCPVIVKLSGGGGGIGMTIVMNEGELLKALESSRAVGTTAFSFADVYIEKYIPHPLHIEFQILGDSQENVIHLGERECSIQRRYQKLIEEAPSPVATPQLCDEMGKVEVNARVQVEHPVTEMVAGMDIVKEQIRIASGCSLGIKQEEVQMHGCAIECRINAEQPFNEFASSPGKLKNYRFPGGIGIRVDSGVYTYYTIPPYYDSIISKLIAWGKDRNEAIIRMRRALYEYIIVGVKSNIPFHKAVMENPPFVKGELGTHFIDGETTLLDDMKTIMEREKPLEEKVSHIVEEKRRVAAISAVAAITQMHRHG